MPRTRYGISPWVHQLPDSRRPEFPRARGESTSNVVIVGAGLTGCATAYACAVAGLRAVVLETGRIGQGCSGRSAGLLLPEPGPSFRELSAAHGLRFARRAFQSWRRAVLDAAALIRRLGVRCGLDAEDSLLVASREDEKSLRREFQARAESRLDVAWLGRKPLQKESALEAGSAIKMHEAFGLDPYRAVIGIARAAATRGVAFFERSHVTKVRFGRKHAEVLTEHASIRAATVIVATGTPGMEFRQLRRHFKRRETYLALTEPMPAAMRKTLGPRKATIADTRVPRHRIRWMEDDRILIGGADQAATPERSREAVLVQRTGQLMYELSTIYPVISGLMPAYGWELPYGDTGDGLPYIGPHRNFPHHLFAFGGRVDSIAGAFLAARILVRAVQGEPDKTDEIFAFTR
ncbi:MAG TPA: FAD-dependent oxidoreductase [Vicinamibacterales bacterium]|jgi:glycine/D-amino acid oxidase-like deaminating enzyme|nr:FAD-dependent oxidoreductase [Vicinamibacterales bacterium]